MGDEEQVFRWVLMVGAITIIPIVLTYRIRSQASGEKLDRRQEGLFILLTLRPVGVAAMIGFAAYLIDPARMAWSSLPLPPWMRWVGVCLCGAGSVLLLWTLHTLGTNLTDTVVTRRDHTLVTSGPYRRVRHPFYCSAALLWIGASLATANWYLFLMGGFAIGLILLRLPREEANLLARFGETYRDYRAKTGGFVPRNWLVTRGGSNDRSAR